MERQRSTRASSTAARSDAVAWDALAGSGWPSIACSSSRISRSRSRAAARAAQAGHVGVPCASTGAGTRDYHGEIPPRGRTGTDFATIWGTFCDAIFCASLSRSCAFCAHFLRILCIFGALGQMQWMHRPADRASRPGVAKYRNAAFVVHFTCIYVHLRTRMQNACRMHVNLHKMALAKLQVHSPDAILPRSSPDHPSPASECHPDRHRGRWLRMHMDALRVHRRECECCRCSLRCSLKCAEGVLNAH